MIAELVDFLLPVTSWLLFASLKSIAIIPLVLLVRRLFARWLTPQGRYALWFAVIACLAVPYGAQLRILDNDQPPAPVPVEAASQPAATRYEQPIITISATPVDSADNLPPVSWAALVWLLGVASLAAVVMRNVIRFRRITLGAAPLDAATSELFRRCQHDLDIRRHVRLLETPQAQSPLVVGYLQPTLLLPRGLTAQISCAQLRLVLLHELAHIRRHDILVNWLATLVQIAHWFNPLAWYALRAMRDDMEHACDATVLRHLEAQERIDYGNTLIRMSDFNPRRMLLAQSAGVIERHAQLKARIQMIAQFRTRNAISTLLAITLLSLTAAIAVTQAATAPQPAPAVQTAPASVATRPIPQPAPAPAKPAARASTPTAAKPPSNQPKLQSAVLRINYKKANELVTFIKSAPQPGLLSDAGSIGVDERTNMILVNDTADHLAAIRQLVAILDVPVQQFLIEAYFALVDADLLKEMIAAASPDGKASSFTFFGPDVKVGAMLQTAQLAHRAEIISAPRILVVNNGQASLEQGTDPLRPQDVTPPATGYRLKVVLKPSVLADKRVQLDVDTTVGIRMMAPNPGVASGSDKTVVPAIDTRQATARLLLDAGATALVNVTDIGDHTSDTADPIPGKRLVAFVTPRVISEGPPRN